MVFSQSEEYMTKDVKIFFVTDCLTDQCLADFAKIGKFEPLSPEDHFLKDRNILKSVDS